MTQNPYSEQGQQQPTPQPGPPFPDQPMNIYPAPGIYGVYPGQQAGTTVWPTVVGIVSLCLAGLGALATIAGLIIGALVEKFQSPQNFNVMANMPDWFETYQWFANALALATYGVLAFGGAMLLRRRRAGRILHIVYVAMEALVATCGLGVMIAIMQHTSAAVNTTSQPQVAVMPEAMTVIMGIVGVAYTLAYPAFVLIWFTRPKVKQHIKTWRS